MSYDVSHTVYCFFYQAEDGIRDLTVTGVQTCALPIWGARVGHERHVLARSQQVEDAAQRRVGGVRVEAHELRVRADVDEQCLRVPRVFSRDRGRLLQGQCGARGEVVEVAERRRHDVQGAGHVTTSPATAAARTTPRIAARSDARASPRAESWVRCRA